MYRNLKAELARRSISCADVAKALGVATPTISEKLNKSGRLKLDEAMTIRDTFFPSMSLEYLFEKSKDVKPA